MVSLKDYWRGARMHHAASPSIWNGGERLPRGPDEPVHLIDLRHASSFLHYNMPVWRYMQAITDSNELRALEKTRRCIFCDQELECENMGHWPPIADSFSYGRFSWRAWTDCTQCGWWIAQSHATQVSRGAESGRFIRVDRMGAGRLVQLDVSRIDAPLEEVRQYLLKHYDDRFSLNPGLWEQTVASVFRDFGYGVVVTGSRGDGGIDVILEKASGTRIGVQVKRYRNTIEAEQIRALTGALILKGLTKGVFATTSTFSRGAVQAAALSEVRGVPIELIDSARFFAALGLVQTNARRDADVAARKRITTIMRVEHYRRPLDETPVPHEDEKGWFERLVLDPAHVGRPLAGPLGARRWRRRVLCRWANYVRFLPLRVVRWLNLSGVRN